MRLVPALFAALLFFSASAVAQDNSADKSYSTNGDAAAGKTTFLKCGACHSLNGGQSTKIGPNLDKIFGRMAGTSDGYAGYSKALRESGIIWSEAALDQWLKDPQNYLPGNKMPFAGIRSEQDRKNLIAYIRKATE